jgi:accessory gene regulator protein AgrB
MSGDNIQRRDAIDALLWASSVRNFSPGRHADSSINCQVIEMKVFIRTFPNETLIMS